MANISTTKYKSGPSRSIAYLITIKNKESEYKAYYYKAYNMWYVPEMGNFVSNDRVLSFTEIK